MAMIPPTFTCLVSIPRNDIRKDHKGEISHTARLPSLKKESEMTTTSEHNEESSKTKRQINRRAAYGSASLSLAALSLSSWPRTANAQRPGSRERERLRVRLLWTLKGRSVDVGVRRLSTSMSRSSGIRTRWL
ncbi:hypothetical protein GSI_03743 [Ganoderma sinense ZZ0214-1]|uniref:Uncharacterized protein n=1 Tax=Ganoderma sinense ZZ0214-1 TaxID=1077348 RepID=A0A2G8SJU8_9APHY|nr:hypothetical protein GSI_03743 [Ganoderma sinense ZZ0214-1]